MKISICLLLVFCSICTVAQDPSSANPVSMRLGLDNPKGGAASDFIQSVKYIPLETKKLSVFGKIDRMEVTDDYFVIQDEDTNSLLFFTRQGKFHGKISGGNRIVNPYNRILRWAINRFTKQVYFIKSRNDICYIYDFNCKKVAEQKITDSGSWTEIEFINADTYLSNNGYGHKGNIPKSFISWVSSGKNLNLTALPYTEHDILNGDVLTGNSGPFYYQGKGIFLYTKSYDYTIYKIESTRALPLYKFIVPAAYAAPQDLLVNPVYKNHIVDYFIENRPKIYEISNCFLIDENLTFKTRTNDGNFKSDFIYNLKSGMLITFARIQPDQTCYYLPLSSDFEFSRRGILCTDGNALYSSISAGNLASAIAENKIKKIGNVVTLPKELITLTQEGNPVIREITLKKSF